jgi:UDP-N-acetylglucosamine--N-acetylmuramyl-(pentapeptide) pyrophosphoryl-undecaprenol N-acetylglucosamine transferase
MPARARVVVAGGHSAGHIEPMMNFADARRRLEPTAEITAFGTVRGLDTTLIPARGYPLALIPAVPLPRKLNRALLQTPGRLRDSVLAAGAVLDRVRAEIVVGFGGYVAGPAYLAARRQGLPVVVHEANAAVSGAAAALRAAGVQVLHITGPRHVVQVPDGDPADPPTSSSATSTRCSTPTPRPTS